MIICFFVVLYFAKKCLFFAKKEIGISRNAFLISKQEAESENTEW